MASALKTVGVVSIGEMGLGIARLLKAYKYQVGTYAADRSEATQARAKEYGITLEPTIQALAENSDCVLSIVPPRDAYKTAQRFHEALGDSSSRPNNKPLYYLDLNAIAPKTARDIESLLSQNSRICLIDGGIIGGPPYPKEGAADGTDGETTPAWHCPSLIVSGPTKLPDPELCKLLNIQHLEGPIGKATGLKMLFASMTKGVFALGIQAFTTAHRLGVLDELRATMAKYNPNTLHSAERGVTGMPSKAYRWVREMQEIATTMSEDGGFDRNIYDGVAEVYRTVAEDSLLGEEKPGARKRGKTVEDVVELLSEGMDAKRQKTN